MSFDKQIADLTDAVKALTEAMKACGGKSSSGTTKTETKTENKAASKYTKAQMQAAVNEVKEKKGTPAAKALIKEHGGAEKLAEVGDDKIDAMYEAAQKLLKEEAGSDL